MRMKPAIDRGHCNWTSSQRRFWGLMLMSSILGSSVLSAAVSWATPAGNPKPNNQQPAPRSQSMGESLLSNMLGADALRPTSLPARSNKTPSNQSLSTAGRLSRQKPVPVTMPKTVAQARTFPDIQGNWAQSFIEALAARNIIVGFPDGTFRPDEPVTRAQFAAMIRRAFSKQPIRQAVDFVDVPPNYWGYTAIQEAYQTGFLEGYPNQIFIPNQNIPRVQVLVSLVSGLELTSTADAVTVVNTYFQDAAQVPGYAVNSLAAATENQIVVNYPNVALLNPNQIATRADVAAFIYQALVRAGQLPPIGPTDIASRYIVGYQPPIAEQPDPETLRAQLRLPVPPVVEQIRRIIGGASSIGTPTAFGADRGNAFITGSFQERTRNSSKADGGLGIGFGVGDAERAVGVEATFSIYDLVGDTAFEDGGFSVKVHRLFANDLAVAVGVENFETFGNPDPDYSSAYGVVSKVFPLGQRGTRFTPSVTASLGVGGGRFRSESDIRNEDDTANVFGSVGVRMIEPISVIGEWTGQDLNLGLSIAPIRNVPLIITPAIADVTNNAGDGARFILGVGYGISF